MFRTSNFDKLLDKATSNLNLEPEWPSIMQICDLIRQSDVQPKVALAAIKKKLTNPNPHVALYALLVLESCVKNCGTLIHDEIGTKLFMEQLKELVKSSQNENVRQKILELIQAWAFAFRNNPKYRAVNDAVNVMKVEGYKFPTPKESDAMFVADTAPKWADGDVCHRCRVQFSFVQRRHHCRACGQVFCGQCSDKTTVLPKFGIEKEVRVCQACYNQVNKPSSQSKDTDLPAEYLNSSLAQQQQVPPRKTAEELQEEEELLLALALSQSEAEQKEKEKKRMTGKKINTTVTPRSTYSPPLSPSPSPSKVPDEEEVDPELAKYLNRKMWEQRQAVIEEHCSRTDVTSPSAPNMNNSKPLKIMRQQNGEIDNQLEGFVSVLRTQLEIFVNRMKSNSSRGRSISNDSSVQTLFMNITEMHSRLLKYIEEQDDSRVYYEGLQDKLTQIKDARAALDALREEHKEKLRKQAEEAERQRQMQMANKLAIMRKKKQEYLQYQRQLALQKIQEQEREMQMRQEQQKQQYIMGGYQAVSGFTGPAQGSPVRHMQYQNPAVNYNPMSPTNQSIYMQGPSSLNQYSMQGYNMPSMNTMPPRIVGQINNQDHQSNDPTIQVRENLNRVQITPGPGMMPQRNMPVSSVEQPTGRQIGQPGQQVPTSLGPPTTILPSHMGLPSQGPPSQITQNPPASSGMVKQMMPSHISHPMQMTSGQINPGNSLGSGQVVSVPPHGMSGQIPLSVTSSGQIVPGSHPIPSQGMGISMITQQQASIGVVPPGNSIQHQINAPVTLSAETTSGQIVSGSQNSQRSNLQVIQGMVPISAPQQQTLPFQSTVGQTVTTDHERSKEQSKLETAELISFD